MESLFPFTTSAGCPRWFFADMNAFYASVEQQECERYRGKPVIVVPVLAAHTSAIAASYEAKRLGIKTGTSVALAQATCRELQIVEARPELYLAYHARLVEVLNRHFATVRVLSVDEMACRVPALLYKTLQDEARLAERVKADVCQQLGAFVHCSVGIAPNVFLAKVASDCQKPDGLTIWNAENLPDALFTLKLTDLPGIGSAMKRRLHEFGITTTQLLWEASPADLWRVWKSVLGERWYWMLRGSHEADYQPRQGGEFKKSVGHSNVLAPQHRSLDGAKHILLELFAKALKRLRAYRVEEASRRNWTESQLRLLVPFIKYSACLVLILSALILSLFLCSHYRRPSHAFWQLGFCRSFSGCEPLPRSNCQRRRSVYLNALSGWPTRSDRSGDWADRTRGLCGTGGAEKLRRFCGY